MKNFTSEFTDADKVIVDALYNKMKQDSKVKRATKTDVNAVFSRQFLKILNKRLIWKTRRLTSSYSLMPRNTVSSSRLLQNDFTKSFMETKNKVNSILDFWRVAGSPFFTHHDKRLLPPIPLCNVALMTAMHPTSAEPA